MGKVLIKCIQTPMQKYFYDRSLDSVVMVNDEEYQILKTVEKTKLVPDGVLRRFVKSGLLRETAIEEIEHPETENLHLLAEHYMGNLILQVTQQCNLRCKYCAYSGNYPIKWKSINIFQRNSSILWKECTKQLLAKILLSRYRNL